MSEEDQMMRAIAMSLGQEVSMEQRSDSPEVGHLDCSNTMEKTYNSELSVSQRIKYLSGS